MVVLLKLSAFTVIYSLYQTYLHWLLIVAKELLIDLYDVACCR